MRCWRRLGAAIFALWHLQAGRVVGQFVYPPAATTDNPVDVSGIVVATGTRMTVRWTFPESFLQSNSNFSLRIFHGPVNGIWKYHTLVDSQPLPAPTSYMWTAALVDASYGDSVPLHFQFSGGEGGQGLNSQSFVVLAPGKTPSASPSSSTTMQSVSDSHSTTSAPSGGVTSPSDSSAATATATGPGVDSSPQSGAQGGTTNSETLRIGLGVGLGLGIPLLLVGTGMAYFVLARWRQRAGFSPKATGSGGGSSSAYYAEQMDPYLVQDIREIDSKPVPRPPPSEIDGRGLYPRQVVHEAP